MVQIYVSRGQYAGYEVIAKVGGVYSVDANIDMNANDITDLDDITFTNSGQAINSDTSGLHMTLPTSDIFDISINSVQEYDFTATELDIHGNDLDNVDDIRSNVAGRSIGSESGGYDINMETGAVLDVIINSVTEYTFTNTQLSMNGNILSDVENIQGLTTTNDIDDTTAGWLYRVGTGDTHRFQANASVYFEVGEATIGFYGATPASKPTVTGSRGGNAALADLLTELATLGLITDSSSA